MRSRSVVAAGWLVFGALLSPERATASTPWVQRAVLAGTSDVSMAFDSSRGVAVCFTGYAHARQTYEWNGAAWTLKSLVGPSLRFGNGLTYDSQRGVTVLFGGANGTDYNNETWDWSGTAWAQRPIPGPPAREYPAMVYDSLHHVVVLVGGVAGPNEDILLGGTWTGNETAWTLRNVPGPPPLGYPAMAYDSDRNVTVLYGGVTSINGNQFTLSGETWEWDGSAWSHRVPTGLTPGPRAAHAMAYDPVRRVTVLVGGVSGGSVDAFVVEDDTWAWNGAAWKRLPAAGLPPIMQHALVCDHRPGRQVLVLHGGYVNGTVDNDTTWELRTPSLCAADLDDGSGTGTPDGGVTIDDLLFFLSALDAGDLAADVDDDGADPQHPDGGVTIDDLLYFLFHFGEGC